jgi:glutamate-1-semialdehyde 2,1-aminomutase|tara:strand:+ start:6286 stop:7521 length:1236 start_codon:yes stop_codon:yes gene_type:complete
MNNLILNEKYSETSSFFEKAKGDTIFYKNKKLIDLSLCSGVLILGHNSLVFRRGITKYLNKNISIFSHPNVHALQLSKNINHFFPNCKKFVFCNSGVEGVFKSLRISRAMNKKNIIVSVVGSWHGSTDQTLFYPKHNLSPEPSSAGLSASDQKNLKFIPYNNIEKSKKILDKIKKKTTCIIIEPITACLPLKNTKPYLKFLEKYCKKNNINLIFDEIITGFRSKKGNVQNQYNIKPDITIIGKIVGGGTPMSVIGLSKNVFNKLNKLNKRVIFGGTFSGNTLSAFLGNETINHIKNNKFLINELIEKCKIFESKINKFIIEENLDVKIYRFDSILRIVFSNKEANNRLQRDFLENKKSILIQKFSKYLLDKNIYYPPNGVILLSTSTNYKNLSYIIKNINEALKKYFKKKI